MIDLKNHPTAVLVQAYNACAEMLGMTPVKKFSDRAVAERRTRQVLSMITDPDKRPEPFRVPLPGGAAELDKLKGQIQAEHVPGKADHFKLNPAGQDAVKTARDEAAKAAIAGAADKSPPPPVTAKERWRKPKKVPPSKICYRPRAGSLQDKMYQMLTQEKDGVRGVTVEFFCEEMARLGAKPTMTTLPMTWSNLGYLFVSQKGYGLEFDGSRIWLIKAHTEKDAKAAGK